MWGDGIIDNKDFEIKKKYSARFNKKFQNIDLKL